MILSSLLLAASGLAADPANYCNAVTRNVRGVFKRSHQERAAWYAHCKKGDLVAVEPIAIQVVCDLSKGIVFTNARRQGVLCVYRGKPRSFTDSPVTVKYQKERERKRDEQKKSGRRKL